MIKSEETYLIPLNLREEKLHKADERITEILIFWGAQYVSPARESLVFKWDYNGQDQILINFVGSSGVLPAKGSRMKVTYYFGTDGMYHGVGMVSVDPGAYD